MANHFVSLRLIDATMAPCGCPRTTIVMVQAEPPITGHLWAECKTCGAGWVEEIPLNAFTAPIYGLTP